MTQNKHKQITYFVPPNFETLIQDKYPDESEKMSDIVKLELFDLAANTHKAILSGMLQGKKGMISVSEEKIAKIPVKHIPIEEVNRPKGWKKRTVLVNQTTYSYLEDVVRIAKLVEGTIADFETVAYSLALKGIESEVNDIVRAGMKE